MSATDRSDGAVGAAGAAGAHVQVRDLAVARGGQLVLEIERLELPAEAVTAVIGPNGSGKSTLVGTLQLLLRPQRGELLLGGEPMGADAVGTRRRMAAAFQQPLLLSMSVRSNVELPLRLRGLGRRERRERAERWLERFGVGHLGGRHARQLSGGEAQRVSLARAFAAGPELLLLDEPFAGLDAPTRAALIDDFAAILSETRPTTMLVTHDRDEALRLGDYAALLMEGRVRQWGTAREVFDRPVDAEAAAFVGMENVWPAELAEATAGGAVYRAGGALAEWVGGSTPPAAGLVCVRPEQIRLGRAGTASGRNCAEGIVLEARPAGAVVRVRLEAEPTVTADVSRGVWEELGLAAGDCAAAWWRTAAVHVIADRGGGARRGG